MYSIIPTLIASFTLTNVHCVFKCSEVLQTTTLIRYSQSQHP